MPAFDAMLAEWQGFFAAQVGAMAALLGLLFVGLSLNLDRILAASTLVTRAQITLGLLVTQFVVASIMLIPDQGPRAVALELVLAGGLLWLAGSLGTLRILHAAPAGTAALAWLNLALFQIATVPYLVGAVLLLTGGPGALHAVAFGMIMCFVKAAFDTWVLLVEINR